MKVIESREGEIYDIELSEDLLEKNRKLAEENKALLNRHQVLGIDVMGSIGSGKTSLILQLSRLLKSKYRIACIAGDLTTTIDAERIKKEGVRVIQTNTGKECHLDANLVKKAFGELSLKDIDLLFIENVGNLICPAEFPLGAHRRIVVVSTTEGPYMILKHPYIFQDADVAVINKIDMAEPMRVNPDKLSKDALHIKPELKIVKTDCLKGKGIDEVIRVLGL